MDVLRITGGAPLRGAVPISGSKNATLPLMAAALLTDAPVELRNVPDIEDIDSMAAMLRHLGATAERTEPGRLSLDCTDVRRVTVGADLTRRLRASFLLLGALVGRTGEAVIAKPGGDDIGMRRVEQHLNGLRAMGAEVVEEEDTFVARAGRLRGARIDLDMPTVTGTENLMMAAVLAEGITVIAGAAREPHVIDLARCLAGMGARISGAGTSTVIIEGQGTLLHGTRHSVTPDYIEAGTYMVAAAATGGDVVVEGMRPSELLRLSDKLRHAGCTVVEGSASVRVRRTGPLVPVDVTTWPHPGFATDLQSQWVALMTGAEGLSVVSEALYENRFLVVPELRRLGARIKLEGRSAIVDGPAALTGAEATVSDIRSGAALVIAALRAEGTSTLSGVYHVDRGYERLEDKLTALGATLERSRGEVRDTARDLSGVIGD